MILETKKVESLAIADLVIIVSTQVLLNRAMAEYIQISVILMQFANLVGNTSYLDEGSGIIINLRGRHEASGGKLPGFVPRGGGTTVEQ